MNLLRANIRCLSRLPKDISGPFPSSYIVKDVEKHWYDWWERSGLFAPRKTERELSKTFSLLLPPPNVTGTLHLGHALTVTIQDTLSRWHRMCGDSVLWIPGSDHAGIATQAVVEKHLKATQDLQRTDMSREDFVKEIEAWKTEKGGVILDQLRSLGASLDWRNEYFTLDSRRTLAVNEAFLRLYDKGLIYRGNFLVNLSCDLSSTVSDIEVEWINIDGKRSISVPGYDKPIPFGIMYDVAYKLTDGSGEIVISTTRPETIPGDVAVAVNPNDPRYLKYIGSRLQHPLCPGRTLPIIADNYVSMELGTGALKITPGHDQNDYDIGQRHDLPILNIIDNRGRIDFPSDPDIHEIPRFTARKVVIQKLESQGLLRGVCTEHAMKLPKCSRSGDIIEKVIKPQWFIKTKDMYERAKVLSENSSLILSPNQFKKIWSKWLSNEMDWCISRQLWWGHRIPMWHCCFDNGSKEWIPGRNEEEVRSKLKDRKLISLKQDPDVLDTWFSSALLPISSLGWPHSDSNDLQKYYPLSIMETGHDILFFWVARMVMLCTELTHQLPFDNVLLHGLICDAQGRKMSKSLGNVVDPYNVINGTSLSDMVSNIGNNQKLGYISSSEAQKAITGLKKDFPQGIPHIGTDGLRFGLLSYDVTGEMINLDINLIKSSGAFCNKMWQMSRFFVMALDKRDGNSSSNTVHNYNLEDKWILSCTAEAVNAVNSALRTNNFLSATRTLRSFLYGEVCDVYIEIIKSILSDPSHPEFEMKLKVLENVILTGMKLIHPFCPFISEEIYQRIRQKICFEQEDISSVMTHSYPTSEEWNQSINNEVNASMKQSLSIVTYIRASKKLYNLTNKDRPNVSIYTQNYKNLQAFKDIIQILSYTGEVSVVTLSSSNETLGWSESTIPETGDIIKLEGTLNVSKEIQRIEERELKLQRDVTKYQAQLQNWRKQEKARTKLDQIAKEMEGLREKRQQLERLNSR
ncbi:valine--tRNA ligase, mitochondrial [Lepeophtheirus salmonis]|uniref:valine--tRNA ligase, mitochondrial n=1 Tax=Lepeophtheirus salmonis TaxID=72036 RepID=UPI001AE25870|nr:valine--tRNA ligase-like [Lepeophtheirus salmonis]